MNDKTNAEAVTLNDSDRLTKFILERPGLRGVRVHLDKTWQEILARREDLAAAQALLGEAIAATAMLTGHIKVEGRLSLQLRSSGTLRTLFTECTAAGTLRGIIQTEDQSDFQLQRISLQNDLSDDALLAITIESPQSNDTVHRYQGLVPLEAEQLSGALEDYFEQSEQLPTRIFLFANSHFAAGLMLQKLPGESPDEEDWNRVSHLFETLTSQELLELSADTLLHRLFHEEGLRILEEKPLAFACSCSQERVEAMLLALGEEEALAAIQPNGEATITCEFCGKNYSFSKSNISNLFELNIENVAEMPSTRLH